MKPLMMRNETEEYLISNKVDHKNLEDVAKKVNAVIRSIETDDVTQTYKLAMAAGPWTAKKAGVRNGKIGEKKEPSWQKRIESNITNLRRDINRLERERQSRRERKEKD